MHLLSIICIAITLAITVFAAALSVRAERRDQGVLLALFLGFYGVIQLDDLFLLSAGYTVLPHALGVAFPVKLVLGPALYFYARSLTAPAPVWVSRGDWPALIAPGIAALVAVPFYILPAADKLALMSPDTRDPDLYAAALLGCQIGFVLFVVSSLVYLTATHRVFRRHDQRLRHLFSRIDDRQVSWLRWVIVILAVGWTGYAVSESWAVWGERPPVIAFVYQAFEMVWISVIAFCGILQQPPATEPAALASRVSERAGLDPARMKMIADRLESAMLQDGLYRNPNLNLREIAEATRVSPHNVSETLSRHFGRNFFDYVNGYRIEQACSDLAGSDRTILEITLDSGFNSRSTFNSAFKKHCGCTPSQFRAQARASRTAGLAPASH